MGWSKSFHVVLCSLPFVLNACCLTDCFEASEPPLQIPTGGGPGAGLVFGTASFPSSGAVKIKIQVEDLGSISGDQAEITAWSGNATPASINAATSDPPAGGSVLYFTNGDDTLPFWTEHILRGVDADVATRYWVFVRVNHRKDDGSREVWNLKCSWNPEGPPPAEPVREFE